MHGIQLSLKNPFGVLNLLVNGLSLPIRHINIHGQLKAHDHPGVVPVSFYHDSRRHYSGLVLLVVNR